MNPLETYLKELTEIRSSGAAVKETSYYGPLANLLNETAKAGRTSAPPVARAMMPPSLNRGTLWQRIYLPSSKPFSRPMPKK